MSSVILGDGGHARELRSFIHLPMLGKEDPVPDDATVVIGIGDIERRRELYEQYEGRVANVFFCLPPHVGQLTAVQIMRGVIICNNARIGRNVLINTGAQIDHDCKIGDHCVISPGAILCGNVTLGEMCFVGAGAIIVENVSLEPNTRVPAGTLVCGQNDMRQPIRLLPNGSKFIALSTTENPDIWEAAFGERVHPDAQPDRPPDGKGAA